MVHHAPDARINAKGRPATIIETLKRAFALSAEQVEGMQRIVRDLLRFRDAAVHPPEEFANPVSHDTYGVALERRFVMFSMESATNAVDIAHRLIWLCLQRPKPQWPGLIEWCEAAKKLIEPPPES